MTEPITPYTTLQMTLEMERMQNIKEHHQAHEQGNLAQEMKSKKAEEERSVHEKEKAEKGKVEDEKEEKNNQENQNHNRGADKRT